jgi:hypothetical protein
VPFSSPTRRTRIWSPGAADCSRKRLTTDQYGPVVLAGGHIIDRPARASGRRHTVVRTWPDTSEVAATLARPRDDLVLEQRVEGGRFEQAEGPFTAYERRVVPAADGTLRETTTYSWSLPWFAWVFALPLRWALARRGATPTRRHAEYTAATPWWAPPDRLDPRALTVLGLLAAASMSAAFVNTLFTQTVNFAADDFGVSPSGVGIAGSAVRAGIVVVLPVAAVADKAGRRRS